jgi:hypothetical protein
LLAHAAPPTTTNVNIMRTVPNLTPQQQLFSLSRAALLGGAGNDYGYGSDYGADRATTPIQGIDYGIAHIIRAEGEWNLNTSQADLNWAEVQRREMENSLQFVQTYFDLRRLNRELRAAERGRPLTAEQLIRYGQMGRPRRLGPSELDPITGQLNWPMLLQASDFVPYRAELDHVFAERASNGILAVDQFLKANRVTVAMLDTLKTRIYEVPTPEYIMARHFLESLAYEVRMPAT